MARRSWIVWVLRVLLLGAAAGALAFALRDGADRRGNEAHRARYACPMHPQVTSDSPADCSICGMTLVPVGATSHGASPPDKPTEVPLHDVTRVERRRLGRRVRAAAWLETGDLVSARLYREEAAALRVGDRGVFVPADASRPVVEIVLATRDESEADEPAAFFHFDVVPPVDASRPGQAGWVDFGERSLDVLVVSAHAILEAPEGPYVLTVSPDGLTVGKRPVLIGRVSGGLAVVQAGLHDGDAVVGAHAFVFDTERRRREAEPVATLGESR